MRAVWYEKHGRAREVLQVGEIDTPEPEEGEVLVHLSTSGVNPSDSKARLGSRPVKWPRIVPHSDGAGVIEDVGPGVDTSRIGERVWVFNGQWERPLGTAAEYIALSADTAIYLPDSVNFAEGSCLGIPAMTAHRALFADGPVSGRTVLITGGAGAVGNYGIQFAKWGGASVIATVSSKKKAEVARGAGADHILNYRTENVSERIMEITGGQGVDHVVDVDFGENLPVTKGVLKANGTISAYASSRVPEPVFPHYTLMLLNVNIRLVFIYTIPDEAKREACADIVRVCEEGFLRHSIGPKFSLDEVAAAHEMIESGKFIGNVVLDIA